MKRNLLFISVLALLLIAFFYSQSIHSIKVGMTISQVRAIEKPDKIIPEGNYTNYIYLGKKSWIANGIKDSTVVKFSNDTVYSVQKF